MQSLTCSTAQGTMHPQIYRKLTGKTYSLIPVSASNKRSKKPYLAIMLLAVNMAGHLSRSQNIPQQQRNIIAHIVSKKKKNNMILGQHRILTNQELTVGRLSHKLAVYCQLNQSKVSSTLKQCSSNYLNCADLYSIRRHISTYSLFQLRSGSSRVNALRVVKTL